LNPAVKTGRYLSRVFCVASDGGDVEVASTPIETASARFNEYVERLFNDADEDAAYAVDTNSCGHAVKR
jgi:hypothetical protein